MAARTLAPPLHVDGALKAFIDAASIQDFRGADPGDIIRGEVSSIRNYVVPDAVRDDYVQSYAGGRFLDSIAYVRNYPTDLAVLSPLLADIATPVQIIVGRDDPYGLAADGQLLHQQLRHSRLDIFDCGHNAWEEDPPARAAWSRSGSRLRFIRCDLGDGPPPPLTRIEKPVQIIAGAREGPVPGAHAEPAFERLPNDRLDILMNELRRQR